MGRRGMGPGMGKFASLFLSIILSKSLVLLSWILVVD